MWMEKSGLDPLLKQYRLEFFWAEDKKEWWLAGKVQKTDPRKATNIMAAKFAAIQYIESGMPRPTDNYRNHPELDALLTAHNVSFHWNDVGRKWIVIWSKVGKGLVKSNPQLAENRWEAQVAAAEYIRSVFTGGG